jgi:Xaa-Pro aminopeptidase
VYPTNLNTPKVELEQRVSNLKIFLQKNYIEGALILQSTDLFYFTGTIQQAHLYVPAHGDPLLMVRKSYDRASAESSIEKILHLGRSSDIPNILKANGHALPATLGLELDVLPTNLFFNYQSIFNNPEVVQRHEPVLVDYVFAYNGYLSDHTRIFSLGSLPGELVDAHTAMLEIEQMIKKLAKPGVKSGEIFNEPLKRSRRWDMQTISWVSVLIASVLSAMVSGWRWMNTLFWLPDSSLNCKLA